jgi:hypothetical protein
MSDVKFVKNPFQFLVDTGLLFEINRRVLHPYGLALAIAPKDNEEEGTFSLWDCRDDAEGILFAPEAFTNGQVKLEKFLQEQGNALLERRKNEIGFIVQEVEHV